MLSKEKRFQKALLHSILFPQKKVLEKTWETNLDCDSMSSKSTVSEPFLQTVK